MANEYLREAVLPTRGLLYGGLLDGGRVLVQPWDTETEKLLAGGSGVRELLDHVIRRHTRPAHQDRWSNELEPRKLTLTDRMFLLYQVRLATFPKIPYGFQVQCGACGKPVHMSVMLEDMTVRYLPDDFEEPFECELPTSGHVLGLRMLRGLDEEAVIRSAQQAQRAAKRRGPQIGDPEYSLRLSRHIVTIDGREVDAGEALSLIQTPLTGGDLLEIKDTIDDVPCGFDMALVARCTACNYETEAALPWSDEFFRPRRHAAQRTGAAGGGQAARDDWKAGVHRSDGHAQPRAPVVDPRSLGSDAARPVDVRDGRASAGGPPQAAPVRSASERSFQDGD